MTTGETKVMVEMTENEQELFLLFCQYYGTLKILLKSDGLNVRNGTTELHFDQNQLTDIYIKQHPYRRGRHEVAIAFKGRV